MAITTVSQRDRGFARLGPATESAIQKIALYMQKYCEYECEEQAADLWLRYRPRVSLPFPRPYVKLLATLHSSTGAWDVDWANRIDNLYDTPRASASLADSRAMLSKACEKKDHAFLYYLDFALLMCDRGARADFIKHDVMPAYRSRFPSGRICFIGCDPAFERRLSLLRMGNLYQVHGPQALEDVAKHGLTPQTAAGLQPSGVISLSPALSALFGNFLPLKTAAVGRQLGWKAVYLFGDKANQVLSRDPFPREEMDVFGSSGFFRGDDPLQFVDSFATPLAGWAGRFRNEAAHTDDDIQLLLTFFLTSYNNHLDNQLEVCNYRTGNQIDFISCFETHLTLDRIALECLSIATTDDPTIARLMSFAVIDQFQELCEFPGINRNNNFHYFCTKQFLNDVLLPAFARLPLPWASHFAATSQRLYDELYNMIRSKEGTWATHLISAGGFNVYRKWDDRLGAFVANNQIITDDVFVGEYVRAARNTHHGYISERDSRRRRFAVFGSVTTASLPDSFTQLPLLMLLAETLAPERMSGRHWIDQATLQTV